MTASPRTIAVSLPLVVCLLLPACTADRTGPPVGAAVDEAPASPAASPAAGPTDPPADPATTAGSGPATDRTPVPAQSDGPATTELAAAPDPPLPGTGEPGIDIVLGEWALVPSAVEAPPGTTTFRFRNMGTVPHALRIRTPGSGGDRLEWRSEVISPGDSGLLVAQLAPGAYEVDCPVEGVHGEHDQLGMEMVLTVTDGAPVLAPLPAGGAEPATVDGDGAAGAGGGTAADPSQRQAARAAVHIEAFAFQPAELRVTTGTQVAWTNDDPTPHTATGEAFDTGVLDQGASDVITFDQTGTFDYVCAIHPTMQGRVVVDP